MFVEPRLAPPLPHAGWLEVICGSMFSGKTEELIRRLNRARLARQQIATFKPSLDDRYDAKKIVSHTDVTYRATPVARATDILAAAQHSEVIGIDEVQFFDEAIVEVCGALASAGKRVIAAGLDLDFQGQPFGPTPLLMATAEFVTKVHAVCMRCGGVASFSYRTVASDAPVLLGEKDAYEARCRRCFLEGISQKKGAE